MRLSGKAFRLGSNWFVSMAAMTALPLITPKVIDPQFVEEAR
jgi:hypothetical protein